jgi:hypothetical protein
MSEWIDFKKNRPGDHFHGNTCVISVRSENGKLISETDQWNAHQKEFDFFGLLPTHWQPLPPPPSATK